MRAPKIGDIVIIYGQRCRVYRLHPLGTVDVESLDSGRCYRLSGLPLQ